LLLFSRLSLLLPLGEASFCQNLLIKILHAPSYD
jgi:hypothetical protein